MKRPSESSGKTRHRHTCTVIYQLLKASNKTQVTDAVKSSQCFYLTREAPAVSSRRRVSVGGGGCTDDQTLSGHMPPLPHALCSGAAKLSDASDWLQRQ